MHKQKISFPANQFNFAFLLILLLKIVDFENNVYSLELNLGLY